MPAKQPRRITYSDHSSSQEILDMARGNTIVVTAEPKGQFLEGIIGDTSLPGTIMQLKPATALKGGRPTWVAAASGTDGKQVLCAILREDSSQGKTMSDAYVSGTRCFLYCPLPGEEVNVRVGEVAGTGNAFAIGDRLIVDAEDGLLVPEAGSPQSTPFVSMEAATQQAGGSLLHCLYTGG